MAVPRFITWLPVPAACLACWVLGSMSPDPAAQEAKAAAAGARDGNPGASAPGGVRRTAAEWIAEAERELALLEKAQRMKDKDQDNDEAAAQQRWHSFLERWALVNPQEALEFLERNDRLKADGSVVAAAWARWDPAALVAWLGEGRNDSWRKWMTSDVNIANVWMKHDAAGAWAWVNAGGHGAGVDAGIVNGRFQSAAPEEISAWLAQHQAQDAKISSAARNAAVQLSAGSYRAAGDSDALLAWIDTLTRADERLSAMQLAIPELTASAPDRVVPWLARQSIQEASPFSTSGGLLDYRIKDGMRRWVSRDAVAAGEWLRTQRDSPNAAALIEGYAMSIAGEDPAAARQWLAQLPAGAVLSRGMTGSNAPLRREDLENLVSLVELSAESLGDPVRAADRAHAVLKGCAAGLTNYRIDLVRESPGAPPVPQLTPLDPMCCRPCHVGLPQPSRIMERGADGKLTPEPPSAESEALQQTQQAMQKAEAARKAAAVQ